MMTAQLTTHTPSPALQRRIQEHKAEMARFRQQHGDSEEALLCFIRESFSEEALIRTYEAYLANPYDWLENDEPSSNG